MVKNKKKEKYQTNLGGDSNDLEYEVVVAPSNFFRTSSTFDHPDSTFRRLAS